MARGVGSELSHAVKTDLNGNIYITGKYNSPEITFGSTILINKGGDDFFVVKYNPKGEVVWAKSYGGTVWEESFGITTDLDGNVLVTGLFNSPSILIGGITLLSKGNLDIFLAKFDPDGNVIWATSAGGINFEAGLGVATDVEGHVYITGSFYSPQLTFGNITLTKTGNIDIFIAKYDVEGVPIWAKSYGGAGDEEGLGIAADLAGNVVLTGYFESKQMIFGEDTLYNAGDRDIFICKHDSSGELLWSKSYGGAGGDLGMAIAVQPNEDILVTGRFGSISMAWDSLILSNTNGFSTNTYLVQMNGEGKAEWGTTCKGDEWNEARGICTDANGNVYLTGIYQGMLTVESTTLASKGSYDVYTISYDSLGQLIQAITVGGTGADQSFGIAADQDAILFITGNFESKTFHVGTIALSNTGEFDLFLAKLVNDPSPVFVFTTVTASIQIYPNPSNSDIYFQSEFLLVDASLRVYDAQGKIVTTMKGISGHQFVLPRNQIPGGTYFYQVMEDNRSFVTSILAFLD